MERIDNRPITIEIAQAQAQMSILQIQLMGQMMGRNAD